MQLTEIKQPNRVIDFHRYGGGTAALHATAFEDFTDQDSADIIRICNQPEVKNFVTYQYSSGDSGEYTAEDVVGFVKAAKENWEQKNGFSYIIRSDHNLLVGAIGIKQELVGSRKVWMLGYWSDQEAIGRGYITNAASTLINQLKILGVKELFAFAATENIKSQNVMLRIGMTHQEDLIYKDRKCRLFTKYL